MKGQTAAAAVGNRFSGKVAIVTGAGSGIGRAIARRVVAEGGTVLGVDISGDGLVGTASSAGERMSTLRADLTDPGAATDVVASCLDRYGRIDVLGNVAGVHATGHATEITVEHYRQVMAVNLDAPFFLAQAAIPHLLATSGNIVNVSSHAGLQGVPYAAAYSMSKGGLVALTRSLAVEYLKRPLRVNAIAPAATNTPMAAAGTFPADVDLRLLGRLGGHRGRTEPDEVAALFAFLGSDEARSVTGAVYAIDNGLTAS
ncbi:SDR family oxidoreductase [Frankia sp. CNm7]|uniref:SDR family oxidoreductase n=1 Tax=Frankia nepalensis TaxID=1836974 RepID=A0A937RBU6_9ACTN|nr:SDR family oxidoreductase [Frankia nepalensis]MBL7496673.1 SDR family oxidoreductase [Frankia nepalensis]MBL7510685.1 SDR family oxidoreductase [Frankia nepalensis]MBL7516682.1 SDR family oxidoreductase [Frankia nepalensis]MBL7627412.1 SDR family oxidoreductase [Frankia nepalensis]